MREPDPTDLTFPEVCLGLATAAAAYFAPPLLLLTLPALGLAMVQRVQPDMLPGARQRLLAAPGQVRTLLDSVQQHGPRALLGAAPAVRAAATASTPTTRQRGVQQPQGTSESVSLVRTLEEQPHRLIIGHTRGGKTTLIHSLATSWAADGARVLVADPDAAPGQWPGCEVAGHGDDIASIAPLLRTVATEVAARRKQRAAGQRRFAPLHLVIDEAQDVVPELPEALALVEDVARRGGKLNVRLTLGVQDKLVGTLGLEGKSALLRNFATADVLKDRSGRRVAVLRDAVTGERVTYPIPALPDPESFITSPAPAPATATTQLVGRAGAPVQVAARVEAPPIDWELLDSLLSSPEPVPTASERAGNTAAVPVPAPTLDGDGSGNSDAGAARSQVIVTPGERGDVHVHVSAQATAAPGTGRARRRGRGLDMRARRQRAQAQRRSDLQRAYYDAGAAGESWRSAYDRLRGHKGTVFADWQAGRKVKPTRANDGRKD